MDGMYWTLTQTFHYAPIPLALYKCISDSNIMSSSEIKIQFRIKQELCKIIQLARNGPRREFGELITKYRQFGYMQHTSIKSMQLHVCCTKMAEVLQFCIACYWSKMVNYNLISMIIAAFKGEYFALFS